MVKENRLIKVIGPLLIAFSCMISHAEILYIDMNDTINGRKAAIEASQGRGENISFFPAPGSKTMGDKESFKKFIQQSAANKKSLPQL